MEFRLFRVTGPDGREEAIERCGLHEIDWEKMVGLTEYLGRASQLRLLIDLERPPGISRDFREQSDLLVCRFYRIFRQVVRRWMNARFANLSSRQGHMRLGYIPGLAGGEVSEVYVSRDVQAASGRIRIKKAAYSRPASGHAVLAPSHGPAMQ